MTDSSDKWLSLIFFVPVLLIFSYIILKHHSNTDSPWLVSPKMDLQHGKLFYFLSWSIVITIALVSLFQFTNNKFIGSVVNTVSIVLFPSLFILAPILIIYFGLRSIKERQTIFYRGYSPLLHRNINPMSAGGLLAVVWGIIYLLIGLIFLSMVLSAIVEVGICGTPKYNQACNLLRVIEIPFILFGKVTQIIPGQAVSLVIIIVPLFILKISRLKKRKKGRPTR